MKRIWKARILTMEPTQRWQIKQQSKRLRGANTKSRFYRTERLIYQKSTPECGGNRYQNIST